MRPLVAFLPLLVLAGAGVGCSGGRGVLPSREPRAHLLERDVEQQRRVSAEAIAGYAPKVKGRLDDPAAPAADILRQLPGVAEVEVLVSAPKPTHRIIHLRDWQYLPPDLFADHARDAADRILSDYHVGVLYREHLLEVELVQLEQESILRCLVKHHGLRRVLAEGLTPRGLPAYREDIDALRETGRRLADLRDRRAKVKDPTPAIDREIADLERAHRRGLLEFGVAGKLAVAGEVEVLPLDDERLLNRCFPMAPDGKTRVKLQRLPARHDAQVRAALASGPTSFIILGGAHDLSASVRKLGHGTVEYVRVTTKRYREVAEGKPPGG